MNLRLLLALFALALMAAAAVAQDYDFDNQPAGLWNGDVLEGDPGCVEIRPVDQGTVGGAPLPPGASGNMLCVDARNKTSRIIVRLNYDCMPGDPTGVCKITYAYSGATWVIGGGVGTYTDDDGSYNNPDDLWHPPVGFPPSTTAGHNSENEQGCDGHTIDFVVEPGTIFYIDGVDTECLAPVPTESHSWGGVKGRYQ